jgi:hypothetical protein
MQVSGSTLLYSKLLIREKTSGCFVVVLTGVIWLGLRNQINLAVKGFA